MCYVVGREAYTLHIIDRRVITFKKKLWAERYIRQYRRDLYRFIICGTDVAHERVSLRDNGTHVIHTTREALKFSLSGVQANMESD